MSRERRERAVRELRADAAARSPERPTRRRRRDAGPFTGLGAALRRLRTRRRMSQRRLAAAAEVTRPMVSAYELGHTQPSLATLGRLLAALGTSLAALERTLAEHPAPRAAPTDETDETDETAEPTDDPTKEGDDA